MRLKSVLSALGIACALVVGLDYVSFAATGSSLILGKSNSASTPTTISRTTSGPAVNFSTKTGSAPFAVNHSTRVSHLNADLLDGKDSTAFATKSTTKVYKFTAASSATTHAFDIPIPSAGLYLVTYSVPTTLGGSANQWASCQIGQQDVLPFGNYQASGYSSTFTGPAAGPSNGPTMGLSASTVINPSGFPALFNVYCTASAAWTTPPAFSFIGTNLAQPAIVTVTKLTSVSVSSGNASFKVKARQQAARH